MSIKTARHRLLYFKDLFQGTVYTALSNSRWLLALLQTWSFIHTAQKNIDGWMATVSSLGGALFNNIAGFGGFLARIQGTVFAAAP